MRLLLFVLCCFSFLVPSVAMAGQMVESIQADFIQEKQMAILAEPLVSKGRFLFLAPDSLRWEYSSPLQSVLLMDKGKVRKFVKTDGRFVEEQSMGLDAMQVVLQEIAGWLDGEITDTSTFIAERKNGGQILLTPREPALANIISGIALQLADESGLLDSVTLFEGENSSTTMVFSNAVLNGGIDENAFHSP